MSPLRSSDRRRTADQIIADYDLKPVTQEATAPEDKAAATAQLSALRNSLLPDNVQSARFTTTHGPDLKQVSGTVYVGAHPGHDQRVLWFKLEDSLYPTVYTLWQNPGLLPLLHTPAIVVQKLQGGADLMTPGLANGPPFPPKAAKDAVVAVASLENPTVPVTVGKCLVDVSALGSVQGSRGHAVQTLHWAGDEIWAYSTSGKTGLTPPDHVDGWWPDGDDDQQLVAQAANMALDERKDGGVVLGKDADHDHAHAEHDTPAQEEEAEPMTTKG